MDIDKQKAGMAELGKFFVVAQKFTERTGEQAFMPVCIVDEIWHELIACPDKYTSFCKEVLGTNDSLNHIPIKGAGKVEWVSDYEKMFGMLPCIWVMDANGRKDTRTYETYIQTGALYASWDCTPG